MTDRIKGVYLIPLLFFFILHFPLWINLNGFVFNFSGDGIKNYFTFVGHIQEKQWLESELMNYPYGESHLYLDCHPFLTWIIKLFALIFPNSSFYGVGIVNGLLLLSFPLTASIIAKILLKFNVKIGWALFYGIGLSILSPQVDRLFGHYAMGYSWMIPLLMIFLVNYYFNQEERNKWSMVIGATSLIWFFVHGYMGMICVCFTLGTLLLIDCSETIEKRRLKVNLLAYTFQVILPMILFYGFTKWTDKHIGRTDNPFGFFEARSNWPSILYPNSGPLMGKLPYWFETEQIWEGLGYWGMGTLLGIGFAVLLMIFTLFKLKKLTDRKNSILLLFVASALCCGALAFSFPFNRYPFLLDQFKIIKNFRGIGRFVWPMFYAMGIACVVIVYSAKDLIGRRFTGILLSMICIFPFVEGFSKMMQLNESAKLQNPFTKSEHQRIKKELSFINPSEYQAILYLPYFHIGSENFGKSARDNDYRLAMIHGFHLKLPLMNNYSTRTSINEAKKLMQALNHSSVKKEIAADFRSDRPILLLVSDALSPEEEDLVSNASFIGEKNGVKYYKLPIDYFSRIEASKVREWSRSIFNDEQDGILRGYQLIGEVGADSIPQGKFKLSVELFNGGYNYGQDKINFIAFLQGQRGEVVEWISMNNPYCYSSIDGDWTTVYFEFEKIEFEVYQLYFLGSESFSLPYKVRNCVIESLETKKE